MNTQILLIDANIHIYYERWTMSDELFWTLEFWNSEILEIVWQKANDFVIGFFCWRLIADGWQLIFNFQLHPSYQVRIKFVSDSEKFIRSFFTFSDFIPKKFQKIRNQFLKSFIFAKKYFLWLKELCSRCISWLRLSYRYTKKHWRFSFNLEDNFHTFTKHFLLNLQNNIIHSDRYFKWFK